jgi:hypothetical protein
MNLGVVSNEALVNVSLVRRTYTIAFTPRQYLSHIDRNRGWPPRSQLENCPMHRRMCIIALGDEPLERDMSFLNALHVEAYGRY